MIKAINITKIFTGGAGDVVALNKVDFEVSDGEFVAITGRSGSGKSTLLYQLGLLDQPTSGDIFITGQEVTKMSDQERTKFRLTELGYIFQDYAILPSLTALENVMVPLLMQGFSTKAARAKSEAALRKLKLEDRMANLPSQLSGGQQQRVAIARAIAHDPKIIFADEPTANLDTETSDMVLATFLELNKEGQTIVMVTHEKDYAALAHRVIELADGKVTHTEKHRGK